MLNIVLFTQKLYYAKLPFNFQSNLSITVKLRLYVLQLYERFFVQCLINWTLAELLLSEQLLVVQIIGVQLEFRSGATAIKWFKIQPELNINNLKCLQKLKKLAFIKSSTELINFSHNYNYIVFRNLYVSFIVRTLFYSCALYVL